MKTSDKQSNLSVFEHNLKTSDLLRLENLLQKVDPKLVTIDGEEIYLPEVVSQILRQVTDLLIQGKAVTVISQDQYLTTQESAKILNISRPYLYQILDRGEIPYTMVGTHKRIKIEDLIEYKSKRDQIRREAISDLIEVSQELGFYQSEVEDSKA